MSFTTAQAATITKLIDNGFGLAHRYDDGIVNMRLIGSDISVFVRPDGSASHPMNATGRIAVTAMRGAGIEIS
jgi:hypothetical protein